MGNPKILIYDGSFNGYLTTIFKIFDKKIEVADIQKNREIQKGLFFESETVFTQMDLAKRVWNSIQNKSNAAIKTIYFAFLSETKGMELLLYHYISSLFTGPNGNHFEGIDETILKIQQYSRMVAREKYRIEATTNFKISKDQIHFSSISPIFDVLPLISKHFRTKFYVREFIIYDTTRKYAIHYNLNSVEIISLELSEFYISDDLSQTNVKALISNKIHSQYARKPKMEYLNERTAV